MNKDQLNTLLKAVKNTYTKIEFNNEMIQEWYRRLSNYDFEDVEKNFNNYVLNGNTQTITLIDLIKDLKTIQQKQPIEGYFYCMRCGKRYDSIQDADQCYERDMDIAYIKKMSSIFNIYYDEYFNDLDHVSLDDINKNYDKFIIRLVEEQKKDPKLTGRDLEGLRLYYKNVILKK